jgi:predicted ATP-grasp superfamily ATP-dependent carboligase
VTDGIGGDPLYELFERPSLDDPVLVMALDGWIDAGLGAATALATLMSSVDVTIVATFDTDTLLDHRSRRPVVHIDEGVNTGLTWPALHLHAGHDRDGRALLVLAGPEPDHSWGAFCRSVVALTTSLGASLAVGLGAFPAPVPHTRATRLASTATTRDLADRVGFIPGRIDVPAGVHAALERAFADAGVPAVGLWARVPHYLAAMPYPAAAAALLRGLRELTGLAVDVDELDRSAIETRVQVDELVKNNPEHLQLVSQLEQQVDAELPSGDELAAELERFLRDQGA